MSPIAKGLGLLFGLPVLLGTAFFYYFLSTGEDRMRATCGQITAGMSLVRLQEYAREHNLNTPGKDSGTVYLGELRSFGRHTCRIDLEAGIVKSSGYSYAD